MKLGWRSLERLYIQEKKSVPWIAKKLKCSEHKVNYWLKKHRIPKRSIAEAIYVKHNPHGDPFRIRRPKTVREALLFGLGLGLYWGEGTRSNKHAVQLGNTDPRLIKSFVRFLRKFYRVRPKRLRFGLQVFSDSNPKTALMFWMKALGAPQDQFQPKVTITRSGSIGTYRQKNQTGVVTVYFTSRKLRDIINNEIARVAQW